LPTVSSHTSSTEPPEGTTIRPVVLVAGPTASGKSALALDLAEALDGVVINADSMQLYRELRILTARPGAEALARAPHRLYGVLRSAEPCSAARWQAMARDDIAAALAAGRVPIVVGGTGLYLRALTAGLAPVPEIPAAVRAAARERHGHLGGVAFHAELGRRDPEAAERLMPGDSQRLIRAWEVIEATGVPLAEWQRRHAAKEGVAGPVRTLVLTPPRAELYAAVDARFTAMIEHGAVAEVEALLALGLAPDLTAMKAVGVRELGRHLTGELSLDDAIATAQRATRNYAKRQLTWLRHQMIADRIFETLYDDAAAPGILADARRFLLTISG
jgi:tRNA dimethylallyltransferase